MKYKSLGEKYQLVSLSEAVFKGLSDDGSLFMPEKIPVLDEIFFSRLSESSLHEIAFSVLQPYTNEEIDDTSLKEIVEETFSFPIPLVNIHDNVNVLELFHGPTQAFKDVGARFLSRLMSHLYPVKDNKMVVLTATSGDTGGAVANGFYKVPGIEVVILYPEGKISPYQENQMTGLGHNIHAISINGAFDDCQRLVKQAFNDRSLRQQMVITSANSINMGRLLPQMVYYFEGVARMQEKQPDTLPVVSVPSGNFGNITAAVLAHRMGLPVSRFLAATNANDVVPRFLESGKYDPRETIVTLANAMDVGDPSNFPRLYALFQNNIGGLRNFLNSSRVTDAEIKETIKNVYTQYNYVLDPHSAAGYVGLSRELKGNESGFFVSTAHPRKFVEIIDDVLPDVASKLRAEFQTTAGKNQNKQTMRTDYDALKDYLLNI